MLEDAASQINRELRNPVAITINVRPAPPSRDWPQTLIEESTLDSCAIQLAVQDRLWNQYAYQFAHEFCHVMVSPISPRTGANSWLEEAICELASVFVLRRMAERWTIDPPYQNWSSYASHLADYAHNRLSAPQRTLPVELTLSEWLSTSESGLRQGPRQQVSEQWDTEQRDKMAVVAYALLPLFENNPAAWNSIQRLPAGPNSMTDSPTRVYLRSWRAAADPRDQHVVDQVMQLLGML